MAAMNSGEAKPLPRGGDQNVFNASPSWSRAAIAVILISTNVAQAIAGREPSRQLDAKSRRCRSGSLDRGEHGRARCTPAILRCCSNDRFESDHRQHVSFFHDLVAEVGYNLAKYSR